MFSGYVLAGDTSRKRVAISWLSRHDGHWVLSTYVFLGLRCVTPESRFASFYRIAKVHAKRLVVPEFDAFIYDGYMLPEGSREKLKQETITRAEKFLEEITVAAKAAGVNCETLFLVGDYPYEVIVKAAQEKNCDLIAMASHGRKGIKGMLLGSETQKVLTHSQIPVLVYR